MPALKPLCQSFGFPVLPTLKLAEITPPHLLPSQARGAGAPRCIRRTRRSSSTWGSPRFRSTGAAGSHGNHPLRFPLNGGHPLRRRRWQDRDGRSLFASADGHEPRKNRGHGRRGRKQSRSRLPEGTRWRGRCTGHTRTLLRPCRSFRTRPLATWLDRSDSPPAGPIRLRGRGEKARGLS